MKAYKQSLEKGVRPEFVFPISVTVGEDEIEVNSKESLKKLFHKRKRRGHNRRKLVYPISVNTAKGVLEINRRSRGYESLQTIPRKRCASRICIPYFSYSGRG